MNDIDFTLDRLKEIQAESLGESLTFADRAGLFAALKTLEGEVRQYIAECSKIDKSYAREKLYKFRWSVTAILGFDIDNGHSSHQHNVWAHGAMQTLEDLLSTAVHDI